MRWHRVARPLGLDSSIYSNSGGDVRSPDITAPGELILGLAAPGSRLVQEHQSAFIDDRFLRGSGTSQAAAVVSGIVALMLQEDPGLTPDEVKAALVLSADHPLDRSTSATEASELSELYEDISYWEGRLDHRKRSKRKKAKEEYVKAVEKLDEEIQSQIGNWKANEVGPGLL